MPLNTPGTVYVSAAQVYGHPAGNLAQVQGSAPVVQTYESIYEGAENAAYDSTPAGNVDEYVSLFGIAIGKKAKERKAEKFRVKMANKESRGYARKLKADARMTLANQGIVMGGAADGIGEALKGAAGVMGSVMGGGTGGAISSLLGGGGSGPDLTAPQPTIGSQQYATTLASNAGAFTDTNTYGNKNVNPANENPPTDSKAKNKNTPYIIAAVVLVVLVMGAIMMKKKK